MSAMDNSQIGPINIGTRKVLPRLIRPSPAATTTVIALQLPPTVSNQETLLIEETHQTKKNTSSKTTQDRILSVFIKPQLI